MELRLALNFHLLSAGITLITIISSYYLFLVFHIKHLTFNDSFEGIFIGNKILKITYVPHTYAYKQKLTCIHVSIYIYIYRNSFFFLNLEDIIKIIGLVPFCSIEGHQRDYVKELTIVWSLGYVGYLSLQILCTAFFFFFFNMLVLDKNAN